MAPSKTKILQLITAANEGMMAVADDTSATEVFSAYLTMAAQAITVAKEMGVSAEVLRGCILQLLVRCDSPDLKVM